MRLEGLILVLFVSLSAMTLLSAFAVVGFSQGYLAVQAVDKDTPEDEIVYRLTEDDLTGYPALAAMILDQERIIRPTGTLLDHLPRLSNNPGYSSIRITPDEEEELITRYAWYPDEHGNVRNIILDYHGTYYRLIAGNT
ncbi:hypothetical protein ABH15_04055 [Methanoculleus taiwanensis]|uniref:Uncharacterized protein n=1 Tax=Methanoculleus taiwanensis TaxID=1550565 RepID=A0A498H6P9_9EURY|nr:hypothetical protein [Methanoculleus taiwanensis]RXE57284.1 hypothetical protein ABH15_04055 [Methanoculleus taiwanensis]